MSYSNEFIEYGLNYLQNGGYGEELYANPGKLRKRFKLADAEQAKTFEETLDVLTQPPYTESDHKVVRPIARTYSQEKGFEIDLSPYQARVMDKKKLAPRIDEHSLDAEKESIERFRSKERLHYILSAASYGLDLKIFLGASSVKGNTLYSCGLTINLSDVDAQGVSSLLHQQDLLEECRLMENLDKAPGTSGRYQKFHSFINQSGYPKGYDQVVQVWELDHYLQYGFTDIEEVSKRLCVTKETCANHPNEWVDKGRISKETYSKINQSM
jgi:hypothetical protein